MTGETRVPYSGVPSERTECGGPHASQNGSKGRKRGLINANYLRR
jgi:hypothetical protein